MIRLGRAITIALVSAAAAKAAWPFVREVLFDEDIKETHEGVLDLGPEFDTEGFLHWVFPPDFARED